MYDCTLDTDQVVGAGLVAGQKLTQEVMQSTLQICMSVWEDGWIMKAEIKHYTPTCII